MLAEAEILGKLNYGKKGQLYVVGDVRTRIGNIGENMQVPANCMGGGAQAGRITLAAGFIVPVTSIQNEKLIGVCRSSELPTLKPTRFSNLFPTFVVSYKRYRWRFDHPRWTKKNDKSIHSWEYLDIQTPTTSAVALGHDLSVCCPATHTPIQSISNNSRRNC